MAVVGVVPIFMGAGAAVLPTVLGVLASVGAVMVKPWAWWGLARRRPMAAAGWIAGLGVVAIGGGWVISRPTAAPAAAGTDWAAVGRAILAREAAGGAGVGATRPALEHTGAVVIGGDYTRCDYLGGGSPEHLKELWRYMPPGGGTMFLASPAVVGNRAYVAGSVSGLGAYSGLLACIDLETGKQVWAVDEAKRADGKTRELKAFFSSPAVTADGKWVVIGQGLHADKDCGLLCFHAATGKQAWVVGTELHLESSPAIGVVPGVGDVAVIGAGAIEGTDGKATGNPGEVLAVRIADGKELWRVPVIDPESSPAMDEAGDVYIGSGFNGRALVALSGKDGSHKWSVDVGLPVVGPITLEGGLAIAGGGNSDVVHSAANAQGVVVAVDKSSGKEVWRRSFDDSVLGGIAVRDGVVICPVRTGEVVALAEKDGHVLWRSRVSGNAPIVAGCAFTGTNVYAVSNDGFLAVLDSRDGHVKEKVYLNDQGKAGTGLTVGDPVVFGGRVMVGSETGGMRMYVGTAGQ